MDRVQREVAYGREIQDTAERIWGWSTPAGRRRAERRAALLRDHARLGPGDRVLEIGCGVGLFTEQLASGPAELTAIDISPDLLGRARRRPANAGVRFEVMNAEATTFPPDTFDAVVGSSILHHLHVDAALREFRRILKPGGRLVLSEPNMANPLVWLFKNVPALKRWYGDLPHETAFFRWSLRRRLGAHGFTGARVVPYDFVFPLTPAALVDAVARLGRVLERVPAVREVCGSLLVVAEKPRPGAAARAVEAG